MARPKIQIKITEANCKYHKAGDVFEVDRRCPDLCTEAFAAAYPYIMILQQGGAVEGPDKAMGPVCLKRCPDKGRIEMEIRKIEG